MTKTLFTTIITAAALSAGAQTETQYGDWQDIGTATYSFDLFADKPTQRYRVAMRTAIDDDTHLQFHLSHWGADILGDSSGTELVIDVPAFAESTVVTVGVPATDTGWQHESGKVTVSDIYTYATVKYPASASKYQGNSTMDTATGTFSLHMVYYLASGIIANGKESVVLNNDTNSVDDIFTEPEETDAVYYDLTGRRVSSPTSGIYVKRVGGKTTKVIVR